MPIVLSPEIDRVDALAPLIGSTPLLRIELEYRGLDLEVYAKYEAENMTGSVKDRMAAHILRRGYECGALRPGDTIAEASSGNTGIAFAALGCALGHGVRIYMPDWMSHERVDLLESFGAAVVPVSHAQGGFLGAVEMAERWAAEHERVFLPRQFDNPINIEAHELTTGPEISRQLAEFGVAAGAFVAGVGTGGTVMGVGRHLRSLDSEVRVHPLEPANSPTLREGHCVGAHRIQGISDEFVPAIVDLDELDEIVDVWDGDAIIMAQELCRSLGLAVGISSGANFLGAVKLALESPPGRAVLTVLPDSNAKYLSTDLCHREPVEEGYLSSEIRLGGLQAVR